MRAEMLSVPDMRVVYHNPEMTFKNMSSVPSWVVVFYSRIIYYSGINKLILLVFPSAFDRSAVFAKRNNPRVQRGYSTEPTRARREVVHECIQ